MGNQSTQRAFSQRQLRVGELVKQNLGELFIRNEAKIPSGLHVVESSRKKLDKALNEGFQFVAYSIDAVFLRESAILKK